MNNPCVSEQHLADRCSNKLCIHYTLPLLLSIISRALVRSGRQCLASHISSLSVRSYLLRLGSQSSTSIISQQSRETGKLSSIGTWMLHVWRLTVGSLFIPRHTLASFYESAVIHRLRTMYTQQLFSNLSLANSVEPPHFSWPCLRTSRLASSRTVSMISDTATLPVDVSRS